MTDMATITEDLPSSPFAAAAEVVKRMREAGVPGDVIARFQRDADCSSVESVVVSAAEAVGADHSTVETIGGKASRIDFLPPAPPDEEDDPYDDLI